MPGAGSSLTLKPDSLVRPTDLFVLTEIRLDSGEVVGRAQGVWMVAAQDVTLAGEGLLAEVAGLLVLS
jgi:hypothetical protein